ncbi:hypothetical protein DITRI_Ditri03aG0172900 [Diplodiscus trichospermus]
MQGTNITVPVSVQKQILPAVTTAETLEGNGSAAANAANLPARRKRKPWSEAEDMELIAAVQKCGVGNWANILRGDFKGDRSASQLAQRWTIIKKRLHNLNVEGNSTSPQLSEAQLATRSALSLALDMPDKNLTAACTNNIGLKTTSCNSALPTTSGEASVQAQSRFEQGSNASVKSQNQSQQGPITSASAHNQPRKGPSTSAPAQNLSQQAPMATKTSPEGPSGSTLKSQVTLKKPPAKSFSTTTSSILDATAVAAGARIGSPKAAASLRKAAQSKNAIHITTSGGSSVKPPISNGTSSHLEVHSSVQDVCTGLTAEPPSSPAVTSSTLHPGSVKSATPRVEHTHASSSSLEVSTQPCNAVTCSPTVECPLNQDLEAAVEIKGSVSDSLPKEQVQENGSSVSKKEPGEGVKEHKAAASSPDELINCKAVHTNETLMVEGDQVDVKANLIEESQNAEDSKVDSSLIKKSDSQTAAEESSENQNVIKTSAQASLNDGCTKNVEGLSTAETGQAT